MSENTIRLTIQEIVNDFEALIRHDEHLDVQFDMNRAQDEDIDRFHSEMMALIEKYIPTYEKHLTEKYYSDDATTYDKALELYSMLYENFKEILCKLV